MPARPRRGAVGERYSKSAEAARVAEYEDMERLTPLERALLALELGARDRLLELKRKRARRRRP